MTAENIEAPAHGVNTSASEAEAEAEVFQLRKLLWDAGYRPVAVYTKAKNPHGDRWEQRARQTPPEAATVPPDPRHLNTGILCDGLRAIDVDVDDEAKAAEIDRLALEMLGAAPMRFRENSPRHLHLYRAADGEPSKRVVRNKSTDQKVEVLGRGQQLLGFGEHDSGVPLHWKGFAGRGALTAITEEQLDRFLEAAGRVIGATDVEGGSGDNVPRPPEELAAVDVDLLEPICRALPNDGRWDDRSTWIGLAHAFKAAFRDDDWRGRALFAEHAERWTDATGKPKPSTIDGATHTDEALRVYDSLGDKHSMGAGHIVKWARESGVDPALIGAYECAVLMHEFEYDSWEARNARRQKLLDRLSLNAWKERSIPPPDRLLGDLLTTTARVFLVGRTGLGKTHLAMAIAAHVGAGVHFLHWHCTRPARVLYIDGEMPPELIQERLRDAERRMGQEVPPGNLVIYSAVDAEGFAAEFPELGIMPPLNTVEGHRWVLRLIEHLDGVDLVIFDNVMSLITGDQKDEIPWSETLPLVQALTARRVGQLWLDHTGHDASRQYGSSTKGWRMDAIGIQTPIDGEPDELGFQLSFEHPGKARRRTPANWRDFQTVNIRLAGGQWQVESAGGGKAPKADPIKLTPREQGWLNDLKEIFAESNAPLKGLEMPIGEPVRLSRVSLTQALKNRSRFTLDEKGNLTGADRQKMSEVLNALKDKGKIGMDAESVWLSVASA